MTKEKPLSEKVKTENKDHWEQYDKVVNEVRTHFKSRDSWMNWINDLDELINWDGIDVQDVKEAVEKLKEEVKARDVPVSGIMEEIDKIFGEFK